MTEPATAASTAETAPAAVEPPAAPNPAAPAAPADVTPPAADPAAPTAEPWNDPARAKSLIEELRRENAAARVNARDTAREQGLQEALRAAAAAAGIELPDNTPATVESVTAALGERTTERDAAAAERDAAQDRLAVLSAAIASGVHPSKVAFLEFQVANADALKSADRTDRAAFGAILTSTVAALVAADPLLKSSGTTRASGADGYGGAGDPQAITQAAFDAMTLAEKQALFASDRPTYDRLTGR